MKRILSLLFSLTAALLFPLHAQDGAYTIEAALEDTAAAGRVYLVDYATQQRLDSARVERGRFRMQGTVQAPVAAAFSFSGVSVQPSFFFLEPGDIRFRQQRKKFLAEGTPLNDGFLAMIGAVNRIARDASAGPDEGRMDEFIHLKVDSVVRHVLEEHPNDLLGAVCIQLLAPAFFTPEQALAFIRSTGSAVQGDPGIVALRKGLEVQVRTAEGQKFSDFTVEHDGKRTSLSDYVGRGQYVLADFWASWCGPCRREMPHIADIYNRYKAKGLVVLGIATSDRPADTQRAVEELGISWPQMLNAGSLPREVYGISAIPHTILFAPDGTILARGLRGEALERRVDEVMNPETAE